MVTVLGRGASDSSGVAVGVAVGAQRVESYTPVPLPLGRGRPSYTLPIDTPVR